jgi:hypothetical protein
MKMSFNFQSELGTFLMICLEFIPYVKLFCAMQRVCSPT